MMQKPFINERLPFFNANEDIKIEFISNQDIQVTKNQLIVNDEVSNKEVYNETVDSYITSHTIPKNTLTNGGSYSVRVRLGNKSLWSEYSDIRFFKCLADPKIKVVNIDYDNGNKVYNQNINFKVDYQHENNDLANSYQFILLDDKLNIIKEYGWKVAKNGIEQHIEDLANGVNYYLKINIESISGNNYNSDYINFIPEYMQPNLSAIIEGKNIPKFGGVEVEAKLVQLIGKLYDDKDNIIPNEDIEYMDNDYLDLTRLDYDRVVFDEGFLIDNKSFFIQLYIKSIPELEPFFYIKNTTGDITLRMYNNKIHGFKKNINSKLAHYASDDFVYNDELEYVITLIQKLDRLDIYVDLVEEVEND